MNRSLALLCVALVSLSAVRAEDAPLKLKDGSACNKLEAVAESGATHHCFFEPSKFGKHDYANQNGRAEHVVNVLTECPAIEILADEDYVEPAAPQRKLRRVSVKCEE